MIVRAIHFKNFKALRDATLKMGRFTLIVGPNGSGKSTAMQAFDLVLGEKPYPFSQVVTAGLERERSTRVAVHLTWLEDGKEFVTGAVLETPAATLTGLSQRIMRRVFTQVLYGISWL